MSQKVQNIIVSFVNGEESFETSVSKLKDQGYREIQAKFELRFWEKKFENN